MAGKRKKALFVTHDVSLYGASRSLQTLLSNLENTDIDIAVKKRFFRNRDISNIKSFYGHNVNQVKEFYFPLPDCYKGSEINQFVVGLNNVFWKSNANAFYNFIRKNKYDYIHINSLVLYQLIRKDLPFFIHIREILNSNESDVRKYLNKATGVIFIDDATQAPLRALEAGNDIVLNNPFDMRQLLELDTTTIEKQYDLHSKTVFSIIGSVAEVKGVDLAIKAFKKVTNPNALLLIVGKGLNSTYVNYCRELAGNDPRIIFYGEESEIGKIYAVSDYIIRCDPQFCIGRTVYEGLYAGCNVIIAGKEENKKDIFEHERFDQNIFLYPAMNESKLSELMNARAEQKVKQRNFSTNIHAHLQQFEQFISDRLLKTDLYSKV